ncbi:MAG TPA: ferrous iron transport protein A [Clostridiaceae bacterium]|nr:ferrous iron transport protein A [Clostridiaceae bacterium]
MLPLTWLQPGETRYIKCVRGNDGVCRHLRSLGLTEGEPIRLTQRNGNNVVVAVRDCRLALDENLALKVLVTENAPDCSAKPCCEQGPCVSRRPHRKRRRRRSVDAE